MSVSPLQKALVWFRERDEMGGFRTAGKALFAGWEPKRSCRAPHREDKTASFSVYRNARGRWRFKDFGADQHGGLVGFVMLAGMDEKQASHWLMEKAGVGPRGAGFTAARPAAAHRPCLPSGTVHGKHTVAEAENFPELSGEALAMWTEGVDHLRSSPARIEALARFRGWPAAWARYLADSGSISMPLYHGRRAIAFPVKAPEGERGSMRMRRVGFHCRLEAKPGGQKAGWRFVPNEKEHGRSTPALPHILHGSAFDAARLLVITGGQWDALTFAFAAGWLGEGNPWPEGVCVIGIRGDSSTNVFLRAYARFWPPLANCLLLPDADSSGQKWSEGIDSFAARLATRCRKVAVVQCRSHKDFNDLHRARPVTPGQIVELLASHGMALEQEVAK